VTPHQPPHVAVIVVCWNNRSIIADCLQSVRSQRYPADRLHTYVVDNGSTDDSLDVVAEALPDAVRIPLGWNSGFAIGNNVGIRRARGDHPVSYVVLLNSDALLSRDWISSVVEFAETRPRGACFQSLTLDGIEPDRVDSRHLLVDLALQARQAGYGEPSAGRHRTQRVFGVNAAAALYSCAFLDAQPFPDFLDEKMWMYLEDVDLSARALVMGWENWTVAGPTARHLGSASTKARSSGFAIRQTMRNQPILWLTNFPLRMVIKAIPAVLRHDRGAVNHLRATGQRDVIPQLLRGRMAGLAMIPYALARRRRLRPHVTLPPEALKVFMSTGTLTV
jgi:GT2 family glycosyltransferase